MSHKIITSAGFGNSGSSAATNFFEEFENVKCIGSSLFECTFIHEPDGLLDLSKALFEGHRLKVDLAVKRFISLSERLQNDMYKNYFGGNFLKYTYEYIESLGFCKWNGGWHRADENRNFSFNEKLRKKAAFLKFKKSAKENSYSLYEQDSWRPNYIQYSTQYYKDFSLIKESSKDSFTNITKIYLNRLFDACDPENDYEYLLFDQLLPPNATEDHFKYFDFIRVIVIDRDPRDLYIGNKVFWGNRFYPSDTAELFCNWFNQTRSCKSKLNKNIVYLMLEDFIFNYDNTVSLLYKFTGISKKQHINKKNILIPEKSEINTRLWLKFNFSDKNFEKQSNDDINYISKQLKKYCFTKYCGDITDIKTQNFIIEKAINQADNLISCRKLSFSEHCSFILNSIIHDFYNTNLIKSITWLTKKKDSSFKSKLFGHFKISVYCFTFIFELLYLLIKNCILVFFL